MNRFNKNIALWLGVVLVFVLLINLFSQPRVRRDEINFSEFLDLVAKGEVSEVLIQANDVEGTLLNSRRFKTYNPGYARLVEDLREKGVMITGEAEKQSPWTTILISWFPMIIIIAIWIFLMRQMQTGGGKAMSFGKSRAKLLTEQQQKVTFEDVAGIDEAKEELEEIIEFLKEPKKVHPAGGQDSERGHPHGCAGDRQDPPRTGHCRGGGSSLLQHQRIRLRGDVCGCGCLAGEGSFHAGQKKRPLHHIY